MSGRGVPNLEHLRKELQIEPLVDDLIDLFDRLSSGTDQILRFEIDPFLNSLQALVPGIFVDISAAKDLARKHLSNLFHSISHKQFGFLLEALHLLLPWSLFPPVSINPLAFDFPLFLNIYALALQESDRVIGTAPERLPRDLLFLFKFIPQITAIPLNFADLVDVWFGSPATREFLNIHEYQNQTYFEQESMETLLLITFAHYALGDPSKSQEESSHSDDLENQISKYYEISRAALPKSKYIVDNFINILIAGSGGKS